MGKEDVKKQVLSMSVTYFLEPESKVLHSFTSKHWKNIAKFIIEFLQGLTLATKIYVIPPSNISHLHPNLYLPQIRAPLIYQAVFHRTSSKELNEYRIVL